MAAVPDANPEAMPRILNAAWPDGAAEPPEETAAAIDEAAAVLARGGLVAIPTETVYGLAAIAFDPAAVRRIFEAKGRPPRNPLIVHVADVEAARPLARDWTPAADLLARRFWPGPLTLVVAKREIVPDIVTAGGDTVAIRCPAHPVARRLLARLGRPIAAPSANVSLSVSPTTAAHVAGGLGDRVELILDAGPCDRGIESTVVDCTTTPPRILRPGPIGRAEIEAAVGGRVVEGPIAEPILRSPGLTGRHYAPKAAVELSADASKRVAELLRMGCRTGWITRQTAAMPASPRQGPPGPRHGAADQLVTAMLPDDPAGFARGLYAAFHDLDAAGVEVIVVDTPPADEAWLAARDRLCRAAIPGDRL